MTGHLPNGVSEIVEYLAEMAMSYGNSLKWNEEAKLKADMMNVPNRWLVITPDQLRDEATAAGMSAEDVELIVGFLVKRKQGRRLIPSKSYRRHAFGHPVDTLPELISEPIRHSGALRDW